MRISFLSIDLATASVGLVSGLVFCLFVIDPQFPPVVREKNGFGLIRCQQK